MTKENPRIVVAEDDPDTRNYLQEVLLRLGYQVVAVSTGLQLVELCQAQPPDLVIADIKMPDMDGIEAAAAIMTRAPVAVILLSGHHDDELVSRATAANVTTYLVKPISEANLRTAIPLALARFQQMQGLANEASFLRQALEDRKGIEKAKGVLMSRLQIDEAEAFLRLRTLASNQNRKLVEVCRQVIAAEEVFAQLAGMPGSN